MDSRPPAEGASPEQPKMLTFASGGWAILLAGLLVLGVALRLIIPALRADEPANDPLNGFKLENLRVSEASIAKGSMRDAIPSLTNPTFVEPEAVAELNRHGKYLVSADRVIGLTINGESRAYPLSILNWHEVVNDTVGGKPVVVTYCPLTDSAVVFARELFNREVEFGVSGLLCNSNLLMYDRSGHDRPSLWSQLKMEAVSGPLSGVGASLQPLPSVLMRWEDWLAQHPETLVLSSETGYEREYNSNPYQQYFVDQRLRFPVDPVPPAGSQAFERLLLLRREGAWSVYSVDGFATAIGGSGAVQKDGLTFEFRSLTPQMDPPVLTALDANGEPLVGVTAFRFAWDAMHGL